MSIAAAAMPAAAVDIITTAPEGEKVEYYADFSNWDNTFGFMGDYHSSQTLVFTDDGSVYIPNLLMSKTMPAYVKGIYDREAKTITVPSGQCVFEFPNVHITVGVYAIDSKGLAGPAEGEFYNRSLVFDVAEDGSFSLRADEQFPGFGICNMANSTEVYSLGQELRYVPVVRVASEKMTHYNLTYTMDGETRTGTASAYREGDDIIWVQGLDPKYPDAWIKVERTAAGWAIKSFQVVFYFSTEDPIVASALDAENHNAMSHIPVTVDESTMDMTIGDASLVLGNITPDSQGSFEIFQVYDKISLKAAEFQSAKPAAPSFFGYRDCTRELEFVFDAPATDTDGNELLNTQLFFRMYVNGEPYIFTTDKYRWIDDDMALVPYNFDNYNFFSVGGSNHERRYVYLQDTAANVKTIGVEMVYLLDGKEQTSDRLVYDIATGKAGVELGIEGVTADSDASAVYYNLQGMPVGNPEAGKVYIRVADGKATKVLVK